MADPQDQPDRSADASGPLPRTAASPETPAPAVKKVAKKAPARKAAAKKAPAKKAPARKAAAEKAVPTPRPVASTGVGGAAREAAANAKSSVQQASNPVALPAPTVAEGEPSRRVLVIGLAAFAAAVLVIRALLRRRAD